MSVDENSSRSFHDLNLIPPVLQALDDVGYERPSPIQAEVIPHVMSGQDVIGQAQTGTGKTAAFALPLLSRINLELNAPQVLVLAPTRELAIQVAEAFQRYAAHMKGFHVLPIYGGQEYRGQLRQLKRGAHVVVGTPGRVVDHIKRGTLQLNKLRTVVLDEADEMLRMGFIDDVEWVLEQTPAKRQIALFSATMPNEIRRIAQSHLVNPTEIAIKVKTTTVDTIRQRYWLVSGVHKLDALTRMLEAEPFDGMIIFVRTKTATLELAEKLEARGFASAPLNGDIPQQQREKTVDRLKAGKLDILVATDVVARGLDVPRISHVINFDIPYDIETYVHRIGRTGRAGRKGEAILFVAPREKRMLHSIERATRQRIEVMELPSTEIINDQRINRFKQRITDTIAEESLEFFLQIVTDYQQEHNVPAQDIAAALAKLVQGDEPLLLKPEPKRKQIDISADKGMERYRIGVGHQHGVKPNNIVGAIANEANISSKLIGRIDIQEQYSTVDLPAGLPQDILKALKKTLVCGQQLKITLTDEVVERSPRRRKPISKKGKPNSGSPAGKHKKKKAPRKEKRSS
ncbi:DEAD/DEAH box helicase [Zooshikella harenae]|uniref:ATP-dependent RNA helicase DeaD n=1 Tax=Zooshikella harenae TaxID=2827238 RepID=A0ABS5ZGR4_9GAMM|nr:DEAD/DEAH box helicase [Zooshikella harenae]MBU2713256.1 DEAD/DEAH box helicase [Zooshikella harenae]